MKINLLTSKLNSILKKRPLTSFVIALAVFVGLITTGNYLRSPKETTQLTVPTKNVETYKIGSVPRVAFQAQVEKTGVIQIVANASGIVSYINVKDGNPINRGTLILTLATNYSGGNALSLQRQLAEKQNRIVEDTYGNQKSIISKQRDIAKQTKENADQLREIQQKSLAGTQDSIKLNDQIISTLETNIKTLSVDPINNASLILSSKQLLSQFESANNQLKSQLRNSNYQTNSDNPPTKIAQDQKEITLEQLAVQEKTLDLNKEISELQLNLAKINESLMYPTAPFDGTVEQILVKQGQNVNPGTPLAIISATNKQDMKAVIYLPRDLVNNISKIEKTKFIFGNTEIEAFPTYISTEATNGNLYAAIYFLSAAQTNAVADKEYIKAMVPVGYADTSSSVPYIPLDSVYQTQDRAFTYIIDQGKAKSVEIQLGDVNGSYVRVLAGLKNNDIVIQDRNVIDGDPVQGK